MIFERATSWVHLPRAAADVSGLLTQFLVAPWQTEPRPRGNTPIGAPLLPGNVGEPLLIDDRPAEVIADEIAATVPERETDDDESAPGHLDDDLRSFLAAVTTAEARERDGGWPSAAREHMSGA